MNDPFVFAVGSASVGGWWPKAAPYVADALQYSKGRWTLDEIEADCQAGNKRLWAVVEGPKLISAIVSVITSFSTLRVCTILLCGGSDVDSWVSKALDQIEEYAAWEGCGQVEIIGRVGWERKCPGYDKAGVWLVKELSQ